MIVSILSLGLFAYPMYRWWKAEQNKELIQRVVTTGEEYTAVKLLRSQAKTILQLKNKDEIPNYDTVKAKKSLFKEEVSADNNIAGKEVNFLMTRSAAWSYHFFADLNKCRDPFSELNKLNDRDKQKLMSYKNDSVAESREITSLFLKR